MKTVSAINPRVTDGLTSQGFYVIGADGTPYVYNNNRSVERLLGVLDKGQREFEARPPKRVDIDALPNPEPTAPKGATILRIYSRIKPVPIGSHSSNENVQRDHFWLLSSEADALREGRVLDSLTMRLCRFAFVDAVRGEPDFWTAGLIRTRSFSAQMLPNGKVSFKGDFAMETKDGSRGLEGKVQAEVTYDGARITHFGGFAEGVAWGASTYTPNPPAGKFPIKFAMVLAPESPTTVAPQAAIVGREYIGN